MIKATRDKVSIKDLVVLKLDNSTPFICIDTKNKEGEIPYQLEVIGCHIISGQKARHMNSMINAKKFFERVRLAWKYIFNYDNLVL